MTKKITFILFMANILSASTLGSDIKNNSLIVYNDNIALVHEERALHVNKNDKEIIYRGVANTIDTDSVNVKLPDSVTLYSQQYRFDKLSQKKLLEAHIGKEVVVRIPKDNKNFKKVKAKLLSDSGNYSIVKTKSSEIISVSNKDIIFKKIPTQLITKPSLVWNISAKKRLDTDIKIDYLIKNISWKSNYILNIKNNKANLDGWITISNRSGKRFEDTKLHVLAGKINRLQTSPVMYNRAVKSIRMDSAEAIPQQAYEGYHLYSVPFRVNIANNEKTQIKFIDKKNIPIKRKYSTILTNPNYFNGKKKHNVTQYIYIKGFNFPMPKGVVRSYSKLKETNMLLGETYLKHTPKNTPIDLKLGENFDLKVTEIILSRDDTKQYRDATIKYIVKNSTKELKSVELLIPFNRNKTSIIDTLKPYKFTKGNFVTFNIKVKKNSLVNFKVHFRDFINF